MTVLKRFVWLIFVSSIGLVAYATDLNAQAHVVSTQELRQQVEAVAQARQENLQKIERFLALPPTQKAFDTLHINPDQAKSAVATLSDRELAQLAARADKATSDFAAGDLSDRDLLLIIAGLAALILIIVAVR